jgi:hypothetical protein
MIALFQLTFLNIRMEVRKKTIKKADTNLIVIASKFATIVPNKLYKGGAA